MPNSQPQELSQELITAHLFDDPFSSEFMEEAERNPTVIHVSATSLPRKTKSRVSKVKMVIQKELKTRLLKLRTTAVSDVVLDIIDSILNMKYVPENIKYCNYLGLSQADYGKVSYVDKDREERLKGNESTMHFIKPGTQISLIYKKSYVRSDDTPLYRRKLTLTSRHLDDKVFPIKEFVEKTITYDQQYLNGYTATETLIFKDALLDIDSDICRILNSRLEGTHRIGIGIEGFFKQEGYWCTVMAAEVEKTEVVIKEVWNFKKRYHTSVGKLIRRLFINKYSDKDITAFAEAYASLITVSNPIYDFSIIEGEALRQAYLESNYSTCSGSLGGSCMRYVRCQSYFDMYVLNPDKIKMGVLTKQGNIAARTLLWNIQGKWQYDRIYYINNETNNLLKNTLESNGYFTIYNSHHQLKIELDLSNIHKFPYLDTMSYYDYNNYTLSNYNTGHSYFSLRDTNGSYDNCGNNVDHYDCAVCGDSVHVDDAIRVEVGIHEGNDVCGCCNVYSEIYDHNFTTEDDRTLTITDDWILEEYSVCLFNNTFTWEGDNDLLQYENNLGYFVGREHNYYTDGNLYYHPEDTNMPEGLYDRDTHLLNLTQLHRTMIENITEQVSPTTDLTENLIITL